MNEQRKQLEKIVKGDKKIIIFGAGIIARATIITLRELLGGIDRLYCCVVTSYNHNPSFVEGVKVIEIGELLNYSDYYVIIAVKKMYFSDVERILLTKECTDYTFISQDVCIEVLERRWKEKNADVAKSFIENNYKEGLTKEELVTFFSRQLNEKALSFEVNLVDHCNLNCQSCNHFSPLAPPNFLKLDKFKNDIELVASLFKDNVGTIMLLGGEPLLHPQIERALQLTRDAFPNAEISIVSNGILLLQMSDVFWMMCHDYKIGIVITKYPISLDYHRCEEIAKSYGVRLTYTLDSMECKTTYKLPLDLDCKQNPYMNYAKCYHANKCVVLKNGRLYTCPISAYIDIFNRYFNKHLPEGDTNSLDLYTSNCSEDVMSFLRAPIPMCKCCKIKEYEYDLPWKTSTKEIEEWT